MNLDDDITAEELKVFLEETDEQIELLDEDIVRLEKDGENPELLQEIFRAAHTIKGSSAMVGHQRMAELTHAMESLLDRLRNGELSVSTEIIDALLYSLDALKVLKEEMVSSEESDLDIVPVVARLKEVAGKDTDRRAVQETVFTLGQETVERLQTALAMGQNVHHVKVSVNKGSDWAAVRCLQILNDLARIGEIIGSAPSAEEIEREEIGFDLELILASSEDEDTIQGIAGSIADIDKVTVTPYSLEEDTTNSNKLTKTQQEASDRGSKTMDKSQPEVRGVVHREGPQTFQSVRIDVKILDNLMNIVEELVIDRSRISRVGKILESRYADDEFIYELRQTSDHIIKVITELQENIMQVRMVPIETIFSRFPRLVRDLAQTQKKKLDFIIEGAETELDRSLIEQIRDPLIHLLRNAVDHGVEPAEKRIAAHKPETAVIRLAAYHEQSNIVITVADDGGGIDINKVKDAAVKRGFIPSETAEGLTKAEALNLIFMAGMSTAEKATEVSGRGVGLDIVRANVEGLSGSISLDTQVGLGSTFTIRLPLTVAIIQGLLVSSGGVIYVIPLVSIMETLTIEPSEIHTISGREIIRVRDSIIPLLRLQTTLGSGVTEVASNDKELIVVAKAGDMFVGIVVDTLLEQQEIVVKSLGKYLGDVKGIAGATILGDGQVAVILDVTSLVKMAMQKDGGSRRQELRTFTTLSSVAT